MNTSLTLIVEDNPGDALLLEKQLNYVGWNGGYIEHLPKLNDAVKALQQCKPAIVFLDLNLPDSSGLETFLTINSIAPDIPIIILSGLSDTLLSVQAVKAGAQDYLVKGKFEKEILLKTILYGIERKKNQLRIEQSNLRYKMALKANNDPLWDLDINSKEIVWNEKVNVFGYPEAVPKNEFWKTTNIHPEDREKVQANFWGAIKNNQEKWEYEYRFMGADGHYRYIHDRGYILRDTKNNAYRVIGTMQDMTEKILQQQRIDEENRIHQQALLKATIDGQEKERDYISKELHDNINQLLTSANLQLALVKPYNEAQVFEVVNTSRSCILEAMGEIRKLSHAISVSHITDIGLLDSICELKNKINNLETCKLKFVHSGDIQYVQSDLALGIYRIIQQQINNILSHSKAKSAVINLDIEENRVILYISDNGVGTTLDKSKSFAGIGLSNIYNRVQAHNGYLKIDTSPGNGFNIEIEFPLSIN